MNRPNPSAMTLAELLADEDYQFKLRFQRGEIDSYFRPTERNRELLDERRHWLRSAARTYTAHLPEADVLLEETIELAQNTKTLTEESASAIQNASLPAQRCLALGESWEPDFLLLKPETPGPPRLVSGCVCFPSSWSLAEKIGRPLDFIHNVVPGLNAKLGEQINSFLEKLRPGVAWQRTNWGLSRSPELNQHPDRKLPRFDSSVRLDEIWLRVEHQALVALPRSGSILFGIRIAIHPLAEVKHDAAARKGLRRALKTMPEAMARYKGLKTARTRIVELLGNDG